MSNIGSNDNKNSQMQNNYWIWLIAYIGIGLVISFLLPFPISFGLALIVFFLVNMARTHIALKRQGIARGVKELYKYSPINYYCMNCGYKHRKYVCPKCGSKAVKAAG
jgi:uncharacterized membrane protein